MLGAIFRRTPFATWFQVYPKKSGVDAPDSFLFFKPVIMIPLFPPNNNVDLGWGQRRSTNHIWSMFIQCVQNSWAILHLRMRFQAKGAKQIRRNLKKGA